MSTVVMKFGGASVSKPSDFHAIAELIVQRSREVKKIIVVISAMANTTNMLVQMAKEVNPEPPLREHDMLITVGERISIALLAMALARAGKEAVSFTGSQSGIVTSDNHSSARIVDIRPHRLIPHLELGKIVIVAGFQGCSTKGEITTIGRNGSDISAVALGAALSADVVEFYKDVGGLYTADPKSDPNAKHLSKVTYDEALAIVHSGGKILHPRCLEIAKRNALPLSILSFDEKERGVSFIRDEALQAPKAPLFEEELAVAP